MSVKGNENISLTENIVKMLEKAESLPDFPANNFPQIFHSWTH